jgi:hypothetical protein
MPRRTTIFVSYCHRNRRWVQRLRVHLTPYDRLGVLDLWDDTRIAPGDQWRSEIRGAIDRAAASILLISPDFLASEFVATEELPKLLAKAERGGSRIFPIIVEPCELSTHPRLATFQAVNSPDKPLAEMQRVEAERVLVRAAKAIGRLLAAPITASDSKDPPAVHGAEIGDELYDRLYSASITLSIAWKLSQANGVAYTLTELEQSLGIRSRKRGYEALRALDQVGWINKGRHAGLTKYQLTDEGARQLQRLAAAVDGPVRRAMLNGSTPL